MIMPPRALDCAPLMAPVSTQLSDADVRRVEPLQRVLLSPLDHETVDDWRSEVNRSLMAVFESDAAMFQLDVAGHDLQYSEEFDPTHTGHYVRELMPRLASDRRLYRRAQKLKAGNRSMLWAPHLEWLYDSEYFNEVVLPLRAFDPLWGAAPAGDARYPAMLHTYHDRRKSCDFFGPREVAMMGLVQPALQAGTRTILRTAANRASLEAVMDSGRDGALVYDLDGGLLHRSGSLGAVMKTRRGEEAITCAGGQMARRVAGRNVAGPLAPRDVERVVSACGDEVRLNAVLLGEGIFTLRPAVLVTVAAGERRLPDHATLRDRFGLTRRQAEVAVLLAGRKTNPEIAEGLCISEHTVRSHVEAVMGKLGVHDRRDVGVTLRDA